MTPPTIRAEMATALRAVNARYNALPEELRPEVRWEAMDDVLDEALRQPDRAKASAAITEWKNHWLAILSEVAR
jgi:hypothetical protein